MFVLTVALIHRVISPGTSDPSKIAWLQIPANPLSVRSHDAGGNSQIAPLTAAVAVRGVRRSSPSFRCVPAGRPWLFMRFPASAVATC